MMAAKEKWFYFLCVQTPSSELLQDERPQVVTSSVVFLNDFILKLFDASVVKGLGWGCRAGVIHQRAGWHKHGDKHNNEKKDALI